MRPLLTVAVITAALSNYARADIVIDLKTGILTETFGVQHNPTASSSGPAYDSTGGSRASTSPERPPDAPPFPFEAMVEVNLSLQNAAPATRVSVTVEHEGKPSGWTTHLGNDINNNGYGGGTSLQARTQLIRSAKPSMSTVRDSHREWSKKSSKAGSV